MIANRPRSPSAAHRPAACANSSSCRPSHSGKGHLPYPTTALSLGNGPLPFNHPFLFVIPSEARNLRCAIRVPHIYRSTTTFLCHLEASRRANGRTPSRKITQVRSPQNRIKLLSRVEEETPPWQKPSPKYSSRP